jgi:hypothetical protein
LAKNEFSLENKICNAKKVKVMTESEQMQRTTHILANGRGRDKSEHGRKARERGELTSWSAENGSKSSQEMAKKARARGTHVLKDAEQIRKNKTKRTNEDTYSLGSAEGRSRHVRLQR